MGSKRSDSGAAEAVMAKPVGYPAIGRRPWKMHFRVQAAPLKGERQAR